MDGRAAHWKSNVGIVIDIVAIFSAAIRDGMDDGAFASCDRVANMHSTRKEAWCALGRRQLPTRARMETPR